MSIFIIHMKKKIVHKCHFSELTHVLIFFAIKCYATYPVYENNKKKRKCVNSSNRSGMTELQIIVRLSDKGFSWNLTGFFYGL